MSKIKRVSLFFISLFIVGFGQPAWNSILPILSSLIGFALFWRILLDIPKASHRFFLSMLWFGMVQTIQLSWMVSHPYAYIYGVLLACALLTGCQFGLIGILIKPRTLKKQVFGIAGLWVLLEWSRIFIFSGLPFNPVGLALSGALFPLQLASYGGVYFLSFIVIFTNLLALRVFYFSYAPKSLLLFSIVAICPYLLGFVHFSYQSKMQKKWDESHPQVKALLIQTGFPIEESMGFQSIVDLRKFVLGEWKTILRLVSEHRNQEIDLIVLPENVVPFGSYHPVFPLVEAQELLSEYFTPDEINRLPQLQSPFAASVATEEGAKWFVTNAYFAQGLSNILNSDLVIGLEDSDPQKNELYSAALHFSPGNLYEAPRYEKRILVPMGEYIPFDWCKTMAAKYGVTGSFTPGQKAQVFQGKIPFSPSICYEELYGSLISQAKKEGAGLLVNLTNDGWYPNSRLPQQHFDHARLRTVENGVSLLRACNTGVTAGIDSLGQMIDQLDTEKEGALVVKVSTFQYNTFYGWEGDLIILSWSLWDLILLILFL